MAEVKHEQVKTPWSSSGIKVFRWASLKNGDTGEPLLWPAYADKSVHVKGTFGAGGSLQLEGSNDVDVTPDWVVLRDPRAGSNKLTFTVAAGADIQQIMENTYFIRPNVTAGDGTTDLTVTVLISR